jgi:hypothetical protein
MGLYTPTITFIPSGVVSVTSTNIQYGTIVNSQSGYAYKINKTYINTSTLNQLFQSYSFSHYDVNGNIEGYVENVMIDPYQTINAKFFEPLKNVILDGQTGMTFSILPNEIINLVFYVTQIANADFISPTKFYQDDFFNVLNDYNKEL